MKSLANLYFGKANGESLLQMFSMHIEEMERRKSFILATN